MHNPDTPTHPAAAPRFPREITAAVVAAGLTWWDGDTRAHEIAFDAWREHYEYGRPTDGMWAQFEAEVLADLPAEPDDDEDLHIGDLVLFADRRHAEPGATEGRVVAVGRCGYRSCRHKVCVEVLVEHAGRRSTISVDASQLTKIGWSRFDPYTGEQIHGTPAPAEPLVRLDDSHEICAYPGCSVPATVRCIPADRWHTWYACDEHAAGAHRERLNTGETL